MHAYLFFFAHLAAAVPVGALTNKVSSAVVTLLLTVVVACCTASGHSHQQLQLTVVAPSHSKLSIAAAP